jgi:hypothetical protein
MNKSELTTIIVLFFINLPPRSLQNLTMLLYELVTAYKEHEQIISRVDCA